MMDIMEIQSNIRFFKFTNKMFQTLNHFIYAIKDVRNLFNICYPPEEKTFKYEPGIL